MLCPIQEKGNAEILLSYCARTLDADTQVALERHMQSCPACSEFAARQQAVWEALDTWKPVAISADFDDRLYARIQLENGRHWWQKLVPTGMHLSWRPALSIAAACVTVVAVFLLRTPDMTGLRPQPARTETVDVEQAERTLEDMDMLRQFSFDAPRVETKGAETL